MSVPPGEHLCRAGSSSLTLILPERLDSPRRTPMDSSSEKCLGSRGPGRPERAALAIASPNALEPPAHPHWPAASTLTTAQAPTCPSTPPVNVSRQHSHCLIKVQGFNRSFEKKKNQITPTPGPATWPTAPTAQQCWARPAKARPARGSCLFPEDACSQRGRHSQLHLICPETGWR